MSGQDVVVVGAGNSAGQAALHLARYASRVTIVARGDSLARTMSDYLVQQIAEESRVAVRLATEVVDGRGADRLESLTLRRRATGETCDVPARALFVLIGAEPHTRWLDDAVRRNDGGYILTGRDLPPDMAADGGPPRRPQLLLETSMPGVFAAGDARHRSIKRVASAVGEGATAVQLVHEYLEELAPRAHERPAPDAARDTQEPSPTGANARRSSRPPP